MGSWVRVVVEFLVDGGVIEPEVGAEVDDAETACEEGGGEFVGDAVGECEEGGVCAGGGDGVGVRVDEGEGGGWAGVGEAREDVGERAAGVLAGGEADEFSAWVAEEDAKEFDAGVSAGSEDGDFGWGHGSSHGWRVGRGKGGDGRNGGQGCFGVGAASFSRGLRRKGSGRSLACQWGSESVPSARYSKSLLTG